MSEYRMAKRMMLCIVLFCIIVFILPTWLSVKYHEKRTVTHELPINIMVEYEPPYNFKVEDVDCLALNIYYETRGDMDAMEAFAISHVVVNRARSSYYPNTICDVIHQKDQFSWTRTHPTTPTLENFIEKSAWKSAHSLARSFTMLVESGNMDDFTHGAMFYHANYVNPKWAKAMSVVGEYGNHKFLRSSL